MVKVRNFGKMVRGTTETGKMEINMDKESFTAVMTEFIKDNGKTISYMDMDNFLGLMVKNTRAST